MDFIFIALGFKKIVRKRKYPVVVDYHWNVGRG